jgi:hypothetical protein
MFSFLKSKVSGAQIANDFFFRPLRNAHADGFPKFRDLFPAEPQIPKERVIDEWLWLEVFAVDLSTYLALGKTPSKAAVLTPFWTSLEQWLQEERVPPLPERFAVAGGGPRTIPAEGGERAYDRLMRRMKEYSSAVLAPHPQGVNYSVAAVFVSACGDYSAVTTAGVGAFFSSRKIEYVKFLRSMRITV